MMSGSIVSTARSLATLSLITLIAVSATARDRIGLYGDLEASQTELIIPSQVFTEAYLIAHVPSQVEGIRAVVFGTSQWLPWPDPREGFLGISWHGHFYDLSPPERILIGFADPVLPDENGNVLLATISFYPHHPDWPPPQYVIETCGAKWDLIWSMGINWSPGPSPFALSIHGQWLELDSDKFTLNPPATSTSASTLSRIKSLY